MWLAFAGMFALLCACGFISWADSDWESALLFITGSAFMLLMAIGTLPTN